MKRPYLPETVDLIDPAFGARSHSLPEVRRLLLFLSDLPQEKKALVMSAIQGLGLMVAPWWMRMLIAFNKWRLKLTEEQTWFYLFRQDRKDMTALMQDMLDATVNHAILGKDHEDPSSAGGFSQRELNALGNVLFTAYSTNNSTPALFVKNGRFQRSR